MVGSKCRDFKNREVSNVNMCLMTLTMRFKWRKNTFVITLTNSSGPGKLLLYSFMAHWIRPQTLNREVPGSNLLTVAVVPLNKALYPHWLVPWKGLKAICPIVA